MSGAEAFAVLGTISSIIQIVDGIKQVYDAATDAQGLPKAFREVAVRLPIIHHVLDLARRHIEEGNAHQGLDDGAKGVIQSCEHKAQKLGRIFYAVIPADSASRTEKYISAAKTLGKGSRLETLMKGMLEDVQLLASSRGMTSVTDAQRKELVEAINEMAIVPRSLPEHMIEGTGFTAVHSGSGAINQAQRDQFNNPGSGHFYHAKSINFGSTGKG